MRAMWQGFHESYKAGKDVEQGLLGTERRFEPEGEVRRVEFEGGEEEVEAYLPFKMAVQSVKERKLFSPTDPEPEFANDLHATIGELLGLEDLGQLEYYTALAPDGSPLTSLDFDHGVDAFFELTEGEGKERERVTFDVSFRDKEKVKADVLVQLPPDFSLPSTRHERKMMSLGEKKAYHEALGGYARAIVDKFEEKRQNRGTQSATVH